MMVDRSLTELTWACSDDDGIQVHLGRVQYEYIMTAILPSHGRKRDIPKV
jgi:hypothetical protein